MATQQDYHQAKSRMQLAIKHAQGPLYADQSAEFYQAVVTQLDAITTWAEQVYLEHGNQSLGDPR